MFGSSNNNGVETQLCTAVNNAIKARNAAELASIVLLEPPFPPIYQELVQSLQNSYPQSADDSESRLDRLVRSVVTETAEYEDEQGKPVQGWNAMVTFLVGWMTFLRDMDLANLLHTYQGLKDLQEYVMLALMWTMADDCKTSQQRIDASDQGCADPTHHRQLCESLLSSCARIR